MNLQPSRVSLFNSDVELVWVSQISVIAQASILSLKTKQEIANDLFHKERASKQQNFIEELFTIAGFVKFSCTQEISVL